MAKQTEQSATVTIKRVYEPPEPSDGLRMLVDRLWPRGITKEHAKVDHWLRAAAPSDELRRWYGHDPAKYEEFRQRYREELLHGSGKDGWAQLQQIVADAHQQRQPVTLVFAAKDTEHSNAYALRDLLREE